MRRLLICLTYENAMKMKNLSYLLVVLSLLLLVVTMMIMTMMPISLKLVKHLLQLQNIGIWIWMALRGLSKQLMMR